MLATETITRSPAIQFDHRACSLQLHNEPVQSDQSQSTHQGHSTVIKDAGSHGRGLFTTTSIRAGDVIMNEKAFAIATPPATRPLHLTKSASLSINTMTALRGAPLSQVSQLLDLYGGTAPYHRSQTEIDVTNVTDRSRIEDILSHNRYSFDGKTDKTHDCCGIFLRIAYINHSCVPNAVRYFEDDTMIIRAARDLVPDEEVTLTYWGNEDDFETRQAILSRNWKFTCDCELCSAERATSSTQYAARQLVIKNVNSFLSTNPLNTSSPPDPANICVARALYQSLQRTYDMSVFQDIPRSAASQLGIWMARAYFLSFMPKDTLQASLDVLESSGLRVSLKHNALIMTYLFPVLSSVTVDAAVYAARAMHDTDQITLAAQFSDLSEKLYWATYGTLKGYEKRYPTPI